VARHLDPRDAAAEPHRKEQLVPEASAVPPAPFTVTEAVWLRHPAAMPLRVTVVTWYCEALALYAVV